MEGFTDRQEEIIRESLNLISEGGIQELTFRNLSRRLGISEPAFYRHFENKTEILLGILDYFERVRTGIVAQVRESPENSLRKIQQILERQLDLFVSNPALSTVLFPEELPQADERVAGRVLELIAGAEDVLQRIVEDGANRGEVRGDIPADQMCLLIMGALRLLVTRWKLNRGGVDLGAEGKKLIAACLALIRRPVGEPPQSSGEPAHGCRCSEGGGAGFETRPKEK